LRVVYSSDEYMAFLMLQVALEHMSAAPEAEHDDPSCMTEVMTDCEDVVLKELDAFAEAPDPFLDDFTEEFEKVYESHVAMQKRLELKKKKINEKLTAIQGWIKIFNNTFILCGLVADQNLHLEELENTTTKRIEYLTTARLGGSYVCCCRPLSPSSSFCSRFYLRIKATKAIVEAAFRGNYVAIQDLNNIKVSVDRLEVFQITLKSPCLHSVFGPPFTPYPLFQWYLQSNEISLYLRVKT
jgi:hypothetical protein